MRFSQLLILLSVLKLISLINAWAIGQVAFHHGGVTYLGAAFVCLLLFMLLGYLVQNNMKLLLLGVFSMVGILLVLFFVMPFIAASILLCFCLYAFYYSEGELTNTVERNLSITLWMNLFINVGLTVLFIYFSYLFTQAQSVAYTAALCVLGIGYSSLISWLRKNGWFKELRFRIPLPGMGVILLFASFIFYTILSSASFNASGKYDGILPFTLAFYSMGAYIVNYFFINKLRNNLTSSIPSSP
jgi:hypothetical protein